jgi:uncharacterized protein YuzE
MNIRYYPEDDILNIELTKDKVIRDESYGWNVNIGYSEKGIAEITILEAKTAGYLPLQITPEQLDNLTKAA